MSTAEAVPRPESLLAVVRLQNEIALTRLDLDRVLSLVVDRACALTGASGAVVELVDGEDMVYRSVSESLSHTLGLRLKRARSLSGRSVAENQPLCCEDAETDDRVDREACRRVGVLSMICVPLVFRGEPVGVIKVMSPRARHFGAEEMSLLALLADTVAASLKLAKEFELAVHGSLHDGLTGLANRRAFDERITQELARQKRYGSALTVALFDLDGFKLANDRSGHAAGDEVLRAVATILHQNTRATDLCFRIGGDEFAVVMPSTTLASAGAVLERIDTAVVSARLAEGAVGISAGAAEASGQSLKELLATADAALYAEKRRRKSARA